MRLSTLQLEPLIDSVRKYRELDAFRLYFGFAFQIRSALGSFTPSSADGWGTESLKKQALLETLGILLEEMGLVMPALKCLIQLAVAKPLACCCDVADIRSM